MTTGTHPPARCRGWLAACLLLSATPARSAPGPHEFPVGQPAALDALPAGHRFRTGLERLPAPAQQRALSWLRSFHFTTDDLPSLHADRNGGIFYACKSLPTLPTEPEAAATTTPESAPVPVDPFPASLVFHSRPGASRVIYLDFNGESVSNTAWNTELGRTVIPARAFSTDADDTTFSDAEQTAIYRIWLRVAEDFAPFDVDVTTEPPDTFTSQTAQALITRNTDLNGAPNPFSGSGGVAYVNVFGSRSFDTYRPAWVYHNNLGNNEALVAEAASHEIGHNLGLSHDGTTAGAEYYGGHGSGDISWGPLMGTGYNRNVSQWCRGDYPLANNTQDDPAQRKQMIGIAHTIIDQWGGYRPWNWSARIDDSGMDMTHETERKGRPYTLVCTKTRWSHERRLTQYAQDLKAMRFLLRHAPAETAETASKLVTALDGPA